MEVPNNIPTPSPTPANPPLPVSTGSSSSVEHVLKAVAAEPITGLDPQVKMRQRAALLEAARAAQGSAPVARPTVTEEATSSRSWRTWLALGGASCALAAAALVLLIRPTTGPLSSDSIAVTRFENVNRLLVPNEHGADLFSVQEVSAQELGEGESLVLTSRVPLTIEQVKATIQVIPSVPIEVVKLTSNSFKVTPKGVASAATSYRISLPTLMTNEDGSRIMKEYSWSLQSQDDLRVVSTLPGNASTYVPVTTGIEFTFNHVGLQVSSSTVTLTPTVSGRVEVHGQTVVFVPAVALQPGTLYEARLNGVKTDAGLVLTEEKRVRFETATTATQVDERAKEISFATEFIETIPRREIRLGVFKGWNSNVTEVDIIGYALSSEQARTLLEARAQVPAWSEQARRTFTDYTAVSKQEAFRVHTSIQFVPEAQGFGTISLPAIENAGFYAVRMQAPGGLERWAFLQVTRIASYTSADAKTVLLWTVNAETNKVLSNVRIESAEGTAITNAEGTAQLPAPAFLAQATGMLEDESGVRVLTLKTETEQALVVLSGARTLYTFGRDQSALMNTWGYLFPDRPLYRTTDEIHFAGIALDRETRAVPEDLHVRITRSMSFIDIWTGKPKIYQDVPVTADGSGRLQGVIKWSALAPGYYSLVLTRGEKPIVERTFEVREFVKPAYTIEVQPSLPRIYGGQLIPVSIQARFFDGTAFPKATVRVRILQSGQEKETREVLLDGQGMAQISYTPILTACDLRSNTGCNMMESVEFDVRPLSGEEGEIVGTASVEVYASSIDLRASQRVEQGKAILNFNAYDRDLRLTADQADQARPRANLELRGEAIGYYYEAIPQGTYYDFIQKEVKTSYRYERRRDQQPLLFRVMTNERGEATYSFPMNPAREYYEISVQGVDPERRPVYALVTVSRGWSDITAGDIGRAPRLVPPEAQLNRELDLGESVTLTYLHGKEVVDLTKTPGLLVFTAARGIRDVKLVSSTDVPVVFDPAYVPNAEVHALTFFNGHFERAQATLLYKKEQKRLTVTLTPQQTRVRPGEQINVSVHVEAMDKKSLGDTQVAIAVVDQALYALTGPQNEDPLTILYELVPNGLRVLSGSHRDEYDGYSAGGAEMGGMGLGDRLQTPRRNFKDTATFQVVTLDAAGNGALSFAAPDNITSWRLTAVAYNADLAAGAGTVDVAVGQQAFVDVVLPPRALVQDAPVMSVRAFGRGLNPSSTVVFLVDAPTLGIQSVRATGTALLPTYFALPRPTIGTHKVTVGVQTDAGLDAIERTIEVSPSFFTKRELVMIDAAPGVGLPPLGEVETELMIAGTGRAALLPEIQALAELEGLRLDTRVSQTVARTLLRDSYEQRNVKAPTTDLLNYQSTEAKGGLKLLPYGSSDPLLTAEVTMTAPELFDTPLLQAGLAGVLANASSTRDEQIAALAALASMQQPVVNDLQAMARRSDLTIRQRLWIAQGLLQAGDRETANELVDGLLEQVSTIDFQSFLKSDNLTAQITYTAELAALTATLNRTEAEPLYAYVSSVWSQDAFPVLAKSRYLRARLKSLPIEDGNIAWTIDGTKEETMDLKEESVRFLTLTAAEAKQFRTKNLSGSARIVLMRTVPGRPSSVPGLQIARNYQFASSTTGFQEGNEVTVTLFPKWQQEARDGCYLVRDHVPGGMQPILRTHYSVDHYYVNDFDPVNGEISFITCKQASPQPIVYRARVVARGTYTAQGPILEHLEYPSISSVGKDEEIVVK
jgi:hypothetical protein